MRYFWRALPVLVVFVGAFVGYVNSEQAIREAYEQRHESLLLGDELRQSSDDLTRMVRSYVATGNPRFKSHYQEILGIREGKRPRPTDAQDVYWDLVLDDDQRPRPEGAAISLMDLMKKGGITPAELAKLQDAKRASDALTRTEYAAMARVESTTPITNANRLRATEMLNDSEYHRAKASVMRPVAEFQDLVSRRTLHAVRQAELVATCLRWLLVGSGLLLGYLLWRLWGAIQREMHAHEERESELDRYRQNLEKLVQERTGELIGTNAQLKDEVEAHRQVVEALSESEARFRFLAENSYDVIWLFDLASERFTYVSPSSQRLLGRSPQQIMAEPISALMTPESTTRTRSLFAEAVRRWNSGDRSNTMQVLQVDQPHSDGHIIHTELVTTLHADDQGKPASMLGVTRDITERKRTEEAIHHLAYYDGLTQLPNRRLLLDRLQQTIARSRRSRARAGLLFIDLDEFKPINDRLGHEVGDWLLQSAARRMVDCLRPYDTAARIGGDEFVILVPDLAHPDHALTVAERIRAALEEPFVAESGEALKISASIGVALYPEHGDNERDLLRVGDEAMYQAKHRGRNRVELLDEGIHRNPSSQSIPVQHAAFVNLVWKPQYACGNELIDIEHHNLFRLANRLLDGARTADTDPVTFRQTFDELLAHVVGHFEHEEAILRAAGYPGLTEHQRLHAELLEKATHLRQRADAEPVGEGDVLQFLVVEVITNHMLHADQDYYPSLQRRLPPASA